jgi:hypothetical protein
MFTDLNFAALFQMDYLDDLAVTHAWAAGDGPAPQTYQLINDNPVFELLHDRGYTIVSNGTRWEKPSVRGADVFCAPGVMNEFEFQRMQDSLVGTLLDVVHPAWKAERDRSIIVSEIACAKAQADASGTGPRFVFAHIEAPHVPVVFSADGGPAPLSVYSESATVMDATRAEFEDAYLAQLDYLNSQVIDLVQEIQRSEPTPPVILVMSDEGYNTELNHPVSTDVIDRLGNLFAAFTPGKQGLFGDHPTMVNVFPTLLNAYLGTSLPRRPVRYFTSTSEAELDLTEIDSPFAGAGTQAPSAH